MFHVVKYHLSGNETFFIQFCDVVHFVDFYMDNAMKTDVKKQQQKKKTSTLAKINEYASVQ